MTERVHFIPVGFDFERLIFPISKGDLEADRVVLITHEGASDNEADEATNRAAELATNMKSRLESSFELIDVPTEEVTIKVEELYEYENLYLMSYDMILEELSKGNEVFINISSMPRTTAFAFATAADSITAEYQNEVDGIREHLHTYYVAPEKYLVLEMIDALEAAKELFEQMSDDIRVHSQYSNIQKLLDKIDGRGVTQGARDLNGQMYVEFPSSPGSDVDEFEKRVLNFLEREAPVRSTSALAEQLAEKIEKEYDESFRSRVQYNVSKLDDKGYLVRKKIGNRLETELSTMGRMWVETHRNRSPNL